MDETLGRKYRKLLFGVRRSVRFRYHNKREGFFSTIRQLADVAVFLSSSSAIFALAMIVKNVWSPWVLALFPIIPAVASCIALVFQVGDMAATHKQLKQEFIRLEQKMIAIENSATAKQVRKRDQERLSLEAREPPQLRVLSRICHNELARAMGYGQKHKYPVARWQRPLAHFWDIEPILPDKQSAAS